MADKKFTLLELHLDEGSLQFGPSSIGSMGETVEDGADETEADEEAEKSGGSCPGRTAGKLLGFVAVLFLLVAVAKRLRGGDDELEELEDLEDIA